MISLVCPCYNARKHLPNLLESLLALRGDVPFEVIFAVDPSSDETASYLRSLPYPFIHVIENEERIGIASSRQKGIEACLGEYVGFVDADDLLDENYLEVMNKAIEGHDAVNAGFYVHGKKNKVRYPFNKKGIISGEKAAKLLLHDIVIRGFLWNKLFRKEVLLGLPSLKIEAGHLFEDMAYCALAFRHCKDVSLVRAPVYHYFKNSDSLTSTPVSNRGQQHLEIFALTKAILSTPISYFTYLRMKESLRYDLRSEKDKAKRKEIYSLLKRLYRGEDVCLRFVSSSIDILP